MILLDFSAADFPKPGVDGIATGGYAWTAFRDVPVLLTVAGIDLISSKADEDGATLAEGLPLSLPDVACWGQAALHHARRTGRSAFELNEHGVALLFKTVGEDILIHSMRREKTVQARYTTLLMAWEDFDRRVRAFLQQAFGALSKYDWWNEWWNNWLMGSIDMIALTPPYASLSYLRYCDGCFDHVDAIEP